MKKSKFLFMLPLLLFGSMLYANAITLYDKPADNSQKVANVDAGQQLIPIFFDETHSDWLKVANPENGNVGWVKTADLNGTTQLKEPGGINFKQRIVTKSDDQKDGPKVYRMLEYSGPEKLKPAQVEALVNQMQQREALMQANMQRMMQSMQNDFAGFNQVDPMFNDMFYTMPNAQPLLQVPSNQDQQALNTPPVTNKATANDNGKPSWWNKLTNKLKREDKS